jgi:hypothetical protein
MSKASTIIDHYGHEKRFLAVLVAAELNARSAWETEFTNDLRERFETWGHRMQLSDLQHQQLTRIAGEF